MNIIEENAVYRHFKGNYYLVLHIAKDSETQNPVVVYRALYGSCGVWVRPYEMFASEVDLSKYPGATQKYRFEKVSAYE